MKFGGILRETVIACAAAAAIATVGGAIIGHLSIGVGLGAGLLVGAANGYALAGLLDRGIPFAMGAIIRILFFSAAAILAASLLRIEPWAVLLGVAAAQFVMVAASIRQGLRA